MLGLVIEKVTGMTLGAYLKQAIWDKVRMPDTTFEMTAEQRKRLARPLPVDPLSGKPQSIPILDAPVKFHSAVPARSGPWATISASRRCSPTAASSRARAC